MFKIIDGALSMQSKKPTYKTITNNNGLIIDYQDIKIAGCASEFGLDRDDEDMQPGAFHKDLKVFMKNALMTFNHDRTSKDAGVGRFTFAQEDKKGLNVEGFLSNAPGLCDLRFKVVEEVIKSFSVGGRFTMEFGKNFVKIHKVALREIALCTIPACEKASFEIKSESKSFESLENIAECKIDDDFFQNDFKMNGFDITEIEIDGINHKITEA